MGGRVFRSEESRNLVTSQQYIDAQKALDPGYCFATAFAGLQTRTPQEARGPSAMDGRVFPDDEQISTSP